MGWDGQIQEIRIQRKGRGFKFEKECVVSHNGVG